MVTKTAFNPKEKKNYSQLGRFYITKSCLKIGSTRLGRFLKI